MTPHNEARKEEIAKTVIMPGDPLRAKKVAETYLKDCKLVSKVRNIYAYTGTYKGKEVTIMASGMGMPSMGIYSYELYKFYDVENIIRVGTAGSYVKELNVYDVLLVEESYSDSSFAKIQNHNLEDTISSSTELNDCILETAKSLNMPLSVGKVYSTDVFYKEDSNYQTWVNKGCMACEMESFALFHNAKVLNKRATCLLTISDHFITGEETTSEERETKFMAMMELALETSLKL